MLSSSHSSSRKILKFVPYCIILLCCSVLWGTTTLPDTSMVLAASSSKPNGKNYSSRNCPPRQLQRISDTFKRIATACSPYPKRDTTNNSIVVKQPLCTHNCCDTLHDTYHIILDSNPECYDAMERLPELPVHSKQHALGRLRQIRSNIASYCKGFRCFWGHLEDSAAAAGTEQEVSNKPSSDAAAITDKQNDTPLCTMNQAKSLQKLSMNLRQECMNSHGLNRLCSSPKCCRAIIQYQFYLENHVQENSSCFGTWIGSRDYILSHLRQLKERIYYKCGNNYVCVGDMSLGALSSSQGAPAVAALHKRMQQDHAQNLTQWNDSLFTEYLHSNNPITKDSLLYQSFAFFKFCSSSCSSHCCKSLKNLESSLRSRDEDTFISAYDLSASIPSEDPQSTTQRKGTTEAKLVALDFTSINEETPDNNIFSKQHLLRLIEEKRSEISRRCNRSCFQEQRFSY